MQRIRLGIRTETAEVSGAALTGFSLIFLHAYAVAVTMDLAPA